MRRPFCILLVLPLLTTAACASVGNARAPDADRGPSRQVTVYEIVGTTGDLGLAPAEITVPRTPSAATDSVRGLLGHEPDADGHESLWAGMCAPGASVRSVRVADRLVTVRLEHFGPADPGGADCDLTGQGWRMQKQQVAWTVRTATGSRAPVRVILGAHYHSMPPTTASKDVLSAP